MTAPLDRVLARLPAAQQHGTSWRDRCPVHDGASATSLSITEGDDGRVLLHCFSGCPVEAIVAKLGLTMGDLYPPRILPTAGTGRAVGPKSPSPRIVDTSDYVDADGTLLYQTVRREPKGFFQRRPDGHGGWINTLDGVVRVLLHLPELLASSRAVWLPEGEKDVAALRALGLLATTAVGGASAPWLPQYTDALSGRHVLLLADNDDPGRARVWTIARALLPVAASVRIVELPDLPAKGDVSDWIARGGTKDELIGLARATPPLTEKNLSDDPLSSSGHPSLGAGAGASAIVDVPPFPVEVFPPAIERYVVEGAAALGVPVDMIAVPLLAFAAGVIGNTRALRVKAGWIVRAILWLAVIGDPGSGKSPALDHARHLVDVLQRAAWERFQQAMLQWELDVAAAKAERPPGAPPPKPVLEHIFTTDATMEALAVMLGSSPGLAVVRDELVGWVKSHNAYRQGGDRQNWLSQWAGSPLKVDRRGAGTLYVPRPTASVTGGIQPDLLGELSEEANRRDGFVDRFAMCWPVATRARWSEATVAAATTQAAEALFGRLRPKVHPEEPHLVDLSPAAKRVFAAWYDENADLGAGVTGIAAGFFAKYPGQCARLSLVLHCLHHPEDLERPVDATTMLDAIAVVEYFRGHLARVLPAFGGTASATEAGLTGRVARALQRVAGAWVPRTELHRRLGGNVVAGDLTAALEELAAAGTAETQAVSSGHKPREEWRWRRDTAEQEDDSKPKNEDMKIGSPAAPLSSYLHIFAGDAETHTPHEDEPLQETFL
jgi:hypothetical protein